MAISHPRTPSDSDSNSLHHHHHHHPPNTHCCTQTLSLSECDSEEESGCEAEIIEGGVLVEGGELIEGDPMEDKLSVGKGDHGCAHYRRRCKIRAPCCNEIFGCRHCHNEVKNANEKDCEKRHDIPRHDIKKVICLLCDHEQDVKQVCENCGVCMGDYYCEKCKFFDDETGKQQYHCDSCGICRIGGRENFFHCDRCASCYTIALQNGHPCVEKSMHQNCPVCFEYLFDSVLGISVLPCGHTMHQQCLKEMHQHAQLSCPMCYKSIFDMSRCWRQLDLEISLTPMPEEYHNRMVWILCNDCGNSGEVVFHIVGQKCQGCGSYNTRSTCPPTVEVLPGLERNLIIEE